MLRRRTLLKAETGGGGGVTPSQSAAADVCLCEKSTNSLIIVSGDTFDAATYPATKYSPVGVVVVPGTHNVYGEGKCGVMSIVPMNCSTPETGGTSEQGMYWGVYGTDISGLYNYNVVVHDGNNANLQGVAQGTNSYAYLPSDKFSTLANPYDTMTGYYYNDSKYHIPSPYNNDGTFNFAYAQTSSPSSLANAMSDFDGIGNTDKIIAQRGSKADSWKPTATTEADYPAASCCRLFHTDGTNSGSWYLPACGELGYIMPRFNAINQSIAALRTAYGVGVQLYGGSYYWSSSECSSNLARTVYTGYGVVLGYGKVNCYYVRAWLRVGA